MLFPSSYQEGGPWDRFIQDYTTNLQIPIYIDLYFNHHLNNYTFNEISYEYLDSSNIFCGNHQLIKRASGKTTEVWKEERDPNC